MDKAAKRQTLITSATMVVMAGTIAIIAFSPLVAGFAFRAAVTVPLVWAGLMSDETFYAIVLEWHF